MPTVPDNSFSSQLNPTSSNIESPLIEEQPSVPITTTVIPPVPNVPAPIANGMVSNGPETVLGSVEEPMIIEEQPIPIETAKVCMCPPL